MLPVQTVLSKYGISKSQLRKMIYSFSRIPLSAQPALYSYKLLKWEAGYLNERLSYESEGTISRFGKDYIIVWSTHCSRGAFMRECLENPSSYYWLSFREAQPEYGLVPVCLISPTNTVSVESKGNQNEHCNITS